MESTNGPTNVNSMTKSKCLLEKHQSYYNAWKVSLHTYLSTQYGLGLAETIT